MTNFSARLSNATDSIVIGQTFGYSHYWNGENVTNDLDRRSGNPGYVVGKPILTGALAHREPNVLIEESLAISQSDLYIDRGDEDMSKFLTVMTQGADCEN